MSAFSPQQQPFLPSNFSQQQLPQHPATPPSPQEMPFSSFSSKHTIPADRRMQDVSGLKTLICAIDSQHHYYQNQMKNTLPPLNTYNLPPPSPPLASGSPSSSPPLLLAQQAYDRKNPAVFPSLSLPLPMSGPPATRSIPPILDAPAPAPLSPKKESISLTSLTAAEYSIASLLASSTPAYCASSRSTAFSPYNGSAGGYKRKWSEPFVYEEERAIKIRRSIRDQLGSHRRPSSPVVNDLPSPQLSPRPSPPPASHMTTITCYHAAVAQKSYGSEKRFLCPPPVVNISGPLPSVDRYSSERPQVSMSVVCETGDRSMEQNISLDENMKGSFKYLHVTGTAKAKQFHLKLKLHGGKQSNIPFAEFDSSPVSIISKPSKKTAKARNVSSCILSNSPVSLFNRINSQTVRTKYMSVDDSRLCAKNSSWSSFTISIVNRDAHSSPSCSPSSPSWKYSSSSPMPSTFSSAVSTPITYGMEIILTDTETGVSSDILIIRKVERGQIAQGACGPVSQMQKVALQRASRNPGEPAMYLSAAGSSDIDRSNIDGNNTNATGASSNPHALLGYQPSKFIHAQAKSNTNGGDNDEAAPGATEEEVDDYLCWTIVGISKFEYTFFEALSSSGPGYPSPTSYPITPFPTLTATPSYKSSSHTLDLTISNFFSEAHQNQPMEIWLGHHGPLKNRMTRRATPIAPSSSAPAGTTMQLKSNSTYANYEAASIAVELPSTQDVVSCNHDLLFPCGISGRALELPILFVRHDGVVYHSGKICNVYVDSHGENGKWSVKSAS